MTLCAVFFFTTGWIAAFSSNNMVYGNIPGPDAEKPETVASFPAVHDFSLPNTLSLCGEMIPLENPHVWEMLDREFNITVRDNGRILASARILRQQVWIVIFVKTVDRPRPGRWPVNVVSAGKFPNKEKYGMI